MLRYASAQTATSAFGARDDIEAYLAGKAYIAVLKHRLTNEASSRTFKEIFDEAYQAASRGTKDALSMTDLSLLNDNPDSLNEQIQPFIAGKAYIAVLKHQLAHGASDKTAKQVFDEAYRAAAKMAHCEVPEILGISGRN